MRLKTQTAKESYKTTKTVGSFIVSKSKTVYKPCMMFKCIYVKFKNNYFLGMAILFTSMLILLVRVKTAFFFVFY